MDPEKMFEQNYNLRASTVQPDSSFALIAKNTSLVEGDGRLFQWCLIYQAQMWSTGIWEVCKMKKKNRKKIKFIIII